MRLEAVSEYLKRDLGRLARRLPKLLSVVVPNVGDVAHRRALEERQEVLRDFLRVEHVALLAIGEHETGVGDPSRSLTSPRKTANGRVCGVTVAFNGHVTEGRDPDSAGNHFALGERTGLVGADRVDAAESLECVELADDDLALRHGLHTDGHSDREDCDERFRDDSDACEPMPSATPRLHSAKHLRIKRTKSDGVDDDLMRELELVDREHDDGQDDSTSEESKSELGKFLLERCADGETKDRTDDVDRAPEHAADGLELVLATAERAVGLADATLDLLSDLADLGAEASRSDDAACAALNNGGGCEAVVGKWALSVSPRRNR